MTWRNEISWGDLVALLAVLVAMWQLVSSGKALLRERRADFYLEQLAEIAVALDSGLTDVPAALSARIRFLPDEFELPLLREWAGTRLAPEGDRAVRELYRKAGSPHEHPSTDSGLIRWLREEGQPEVERAVAQVLEMRLSCWQRWLRRGLGREHPERIRDR